MYDLQLDLTAFKLYSFNLFIHYYLNWIYIFLYQQNIIYNILFFIIIDIYINNNYYCIHYIIIHLFDC